MKIVSFALIMPLISCTPIKSTLINQYKLDTYERLAPHGQALHRSILISQPDAMAGYQTEQMVYVDKPFAFNTFVESTWISSPANMLYPLLVQSFQQDKTFSAVISSPYNDKVDYRLDTQILALRQNFLVKPSVLELSVKIVLTRIEDSQVLGSQLIQERIPCGSDTPYGGVVAANKATQLLIQKIRHFAIQKIQQDTGYKHGQTT
ncbi:MAG: ABC-type transport auxiliary lipoprotein family protein [Legionellaceae bacterium]